MRLAAEKLTNVETVLGTADDPKLPSSAVDLILMVDVYHELEYPFEVMESIVRALKLQPRLYNKLRDSFHSNAVQLDRLSARAKQAGGSPPRAGSLPTRPDQKQVEHHL